MKVVVDARWTRTDHHDGISRYGASLIEALHELHPVTMLIHDEAQLALLPAGVPHVKVNNPMSVRELFIAQRLNRLGADVVFSPMQVIGGFRRHYKLILTLHDLIYYRHPAPPSALPLPVRVLWRLYHLAFWPQRLLLNRADAVVTVSETTKDLMRQHGLTRRSITVVPNAPQPGESTVDETDASREESGTARDLVYMGSFMPYKNVETLVAGMADLPGHRLHLLSRIEPARRDQLRALVPEGAEVVFWNGIGEADYRRLLSRAHALVTASKEEGFGLPVIEAMNAGTPVVCSELPIFREVTGGHAWFFPADSAAGFAEAVRNSHDAEQRASVTRAARKHAASFTWDRSARQLWALMSAEVGRFRRDDVRAGRRETPPGASLRPGNCRTQS